MNKLHSEIYLSLFTPTRQEMLSLWLKRKGFTNVKVAKHVRMSERGVGILLNAETAPTHRIHSLASLGIPLPLLPEAKDIPPGPKPKQ